MTRRKFVAGAAVLTGGICAAGFAILSSRRRQTDVRIEHVTHSYEEHLFRAPLRFARANVNRQTMLTVQCTGRTASGKTATGFGILPLNYVFTFPSERLSAETRLGAMKALADEIARITRAYQEYAHPIDANWELAPLYQNAAAEVSRRWQLADPIPK